MKPWENKNIKSPEQAIKIINANLSDIKVDKIKFLGEGWDNTIWIINDIVNPIVI